MFRRKSFFASLAAATMVFSTGVSAASISVSDAIQNFSNEDDALKAPLAGQDVPDTDRSVMNIGDTPVLKSPSAGDTDFQLEDFQQNFFDIDNGNLFGESYRMMNEDGSTASIPFQL